jgi:DNA-binding response OmpR family regulator
LDESRPHRKSEPLDIGVPFTDTVLVVDDEDAFRSLVVRQLNSSGFNTMEARDGAEAVHVFSERGRQISAVLLDLVMPNTSGSETLSMLRAFAPGLPVILTSGFSEQEARMLQGTERGVGFLGKPFTRAELAAEVRRVIGERLPKSRHFTPPKPAVAKRRTIRLLLLEDSADDQELVRVMLRRSEEFTFDIEVVGRLAEAEARLNESHRFDALLVDLSLPDSRDVDTIRRIHAAAPSVPIIALTGRDELSTELAALAIGAQDYLIKGLDDARALTRAIRHAMERKRLENEKALLTDQLRRALADEDVAELDEARERRKTPR